MKKIKRKTYQEERALYGVDGVELISCAFSGEEDGESALKEARNVTARDCTFELRYPLWHVNGAVIDGSRMTESCRAALWYAKNVSITNSSMCGIKAVRECDGVNIMECDVHSSEFGWFTKNMTIDHSHVSGEYPFLRSENLTLKNVMLSGKYSFQYVNGAVITNCVLDTKDAFWHCENVIVKDSVVRGEYLGWYSNGLKLINCKIIGTQPLCYATDLTLENCTMEDADLAFEKSDVNATVTGNIVSVFNARSGSIECDGVGEIIFNDPDCNAEVKVRKA